MTPHRRLLIALTVRSISTLPPASRPWGEAMLVELDEVPGDWEALGWTLGTIRTARRLRRESVIHASGMPTWLHRAVAMSWPVAVGLGVAAVLWGLHDWITAPLNQDFPRETVFVLAVAYPLPLALMPVVGWMLLHLRWRRRSGVGMRPRTRQLVTVAEIAGIAVLAVLWTSRVSAFFSNTVPSPAHPDFVTEAMISAVLLIPLTMGYLAMWFPLVVLLEMLRRGARASLGHGRSITSFRASS